MFETIINSSPYQQHMIIDQQSTVPPYDSLHGITQTFQPISGPFPIGDNYDGSMMCTNNQTGRAYAANPCGYWRKEIPHIMNHHEIEDITVTGSLFPTQKGGVTVPPKNRVKEGYSRIGEEYRKS